LRSNNGDDMHIPLLDWLLAAAFFVVTAFLYWGFVNQSGVLVGYVIPVFAALVAVVLGIAYVLELLKASKDAYDK